MKAISVKPISINGNGEQVVDAFVVSDTVPLTLPTSGDGIEGMNANDVFAPFSILYVINNADTKIFIANESGAFVAQQ